MFVLAMDEATRLWVERTARTAYWDRLASYSDTVFLLFFLVAAIFMLVGCMAPRDPHTPSALARFSRVRGALMQGGAVVLFILLLISQQVLVDNNRGFVADQNKRHEAKIRQMKKSSDTAAVLQAEYLYVPQGNSLAYMTLGNTSIAADYMWLTSLQYVTSSFRRGQKFEMLMRFYESMIELDPKWTEAQINAGRVLSALEPDRYAVERFYMKAIQKNPDSWKLTFEAGRLFIVSPTSKKLKQDYAARASHWFNRTLFKLRQLPDATTDSRTITNIKQTEVLLSQMSLDSGQIDASDTMLWEIAVDKQNPMAMRWAAAQDWLTARSLYIESKLKEQVDLIKEKTGAFPPTLEPAFEALNSNPRIMRTDPFGFRFAYSPVSGAVRSQGVLARATLQAEAILEPLLIMFANEKGRPVNDLNELQAFVKIKYSPPNAPAGPGITEWIGEELNVLTTPLGGPWKLNEQRIGVELPPNIDPQLVNKSARKFFPDMFE